MPIYEYHCQHCNKEFERLELRIVELPVTQCPFCKGAALKVISVPADNALREPFDPTAREKLPGWHKKQKRYEWQDAWKRYRAANPIPSDKGSGCKVYHSDGLKEE